jgi:putative glycerol-1-phosphate prenyltransferase
MKMPIYHTLAEKKKQGKKSFAVLIDPDKVNPALLEELIQRSLDAKVDYLLVGGSLVISNHLDECVQQIKKSCDIPVILFPGSPSQVSKYADALLYLSLISGRNPELLIGQHVVSAPFVKQSGLEIMPTGYIVVDGGAPTTVSYISNGAKRPITESMIKAVADHIDVPLIVGGGILQPEKAYLNCKAGADVIVVGNAIEKDANLIREMSDAVHSVPVKAG